MGVPTLFLSIIKNKYYKNVHNGVKNGNVDCDYFFLDYNGIVYKAYERVKKGSAFIVPGCKLFLILIYIGLSFQLLRTSN